MTLPSTSAAAPRPKGRPPLLARSIVLPARQRGTPQRGREIRSQGARPCGDSATSLFAGLTAPQGLPYPNNKRGRGLAHDSAKLKERCRNARFPAPYSIEETEGLRALGYGARLLHRPGRQRERRSPTSILRTRPARHAAAHPNDPTRRGTANQLPSWG